MEPFYDTHAHLTFPDFAGDIPGLIEGAGPGDLVISKVLQKTFLDIDEKGTEAAAATTIGMIQRTSVHRPPVQFRVDRPFILTIEHLPSKTLLFVGRVLNPVK